MKIYNQLTQQSQHHAMQSMDGLVSDQLWGEVNTKVNAKVYQTVTLQLSLLVASKMNEEIYGIM